MATTVMRDFKPFGGINWGMRSLIFFSLVAVFVASPVFAVPITYSFEGFGTGILGASTFTDVPFTIALQSDTTLITNPSGLGFIFATPPSPTSINVQGIGTASFSSGLSVYVNQDISELGLTEPGSNDLFAVRNPVFESYNLKAAFGPFTEPAPVNFVTFFSLQTTLGPATLSDLRDLTFTAEVQAVPEPQTLGLGLLSGFALLSAMRLKRTERT